VVLCGCSLRPPSALGPDRIVRLASEAGYDGLAVDGAVTLEMLPALATEGMRSGLRVQICMCPLPEAPLGKGKRLPHLAAWDDPEERLAAIKLARRAIDQGGGLEVGLFVLDLGPLALRTREEELRRRFARREMDEGEPGHRLLRTALAERKASAERILDACRASLEPLLAAADRQGRALALPLAASPWQAPSPREALALLNEFSGAPLGVVLAPARRAVLEALGIAGPPERWPLLEKAASAIWASDVVGLESDLLLGLGELGALPALPEGKRAPIVIAGRADATIREVARARRLGEKLTRPADPSAAS
jgi:hypothetical protein